MIRFLLSPALILIPVFLATAAPPKDPQVEKNLRALFDKWDLNHDQFLDRDELAKHFRGAKAVSPPGGAYDEKGNISPLYKQARTKYPDLTFLWSLDTDVDDRISWPEFEKYGQQYAAALKQRVQAQQRMLQQIYAQANRNVRAVQQRRVNYVRHAHRSSGRRPQRHAVNHYHRNVANSQRQVARYQAEMMRQYRYAVERQRNYYRMAVQQRRRWLQQYQSYVRQRMAFAHRLAMRHFAARGRRR